MHPTFRALALLVAYGLLAALPLPLSAQTAPSPATPITDPNPITDPSPYDPTADDLNSGARLLHDPTHPTHPYSFRWWGLSGHYYFVEQSEDLRSPWQPIPYAKLGADDVEGIDFTTTAPAQFLRLVYTTDLASSLLTGDQDEDRVTNGDEMRLGTDPYDNTSADGDLLPDDWERWTFGHLDQSALSDYDQDYINDVEEFIAKTDPRVAAPEQPLAFDPPPGRYVGARQLRLAFTRHRGIVRFTTDGHDPTTDSPEFYPSLSLDTLANSRLSIKTRLFRSDGTFSPVLTHVYQIVPYDTPSRTVYLGVPKGTYAPNFNYTYDPTALALSTNAVNSGPGASRFTLGPGWLITGTDGKLNFTPDLSILPQNLYYGSVLVPSGFNQSEPLLGFSTTAADYYEIPNYKNYRDQGTGWLTSWQAMQRHIDRSHPEPIYYENVSFAQGGTAINPWLYTTAGLNAYNTYSVGTGWVTGPGDFEPDMRAPARLIYYGQVTGWGSNLASIYSPELTTFQRTTPTARSYKYIPLSLGWSRGHKGIVPDRAIPPVMFYYGVAQKGSFAGPLTPSISSSIAHLAGADYAPGFHQYITLGSGYALSATAFEPSKKISPQTIYTGGNALYPQSIAPVHVGPYMATSTRAIANPQPVSVGSTPNILNTGWLKRDEVTGSTFIPYQDDKDGLSFEEELTNGTDPFEDDTDGDGLKDGFEVHPPGGGPPTNPLKSDSDGDDLDDDIDPLPGDPSNGTDALVPLDRPILKVDASVFSLVKHGYPSFQPEQDKNRYLKSTAERVFTYTGPPGINAPESALDETLTSTVDPLTGEVTVKDSNTLNDNPFSGTSTVMSPTERRTTATLTPYDDYPNQLNDGEVSAVENEKLEQPYTTQDMIDLARRHYPEWPGEYASRTAKAYWRLETNAAGEEVAIHLRRIRYKFCWRDLPENRESKTVRWLVKFTAPEDPEAPPGTPPPEPSYKGYKWTGTALEYLAPEIIPDKPGTWAVIVYDAALQVDADRSGSIDTSETTTEAAPYRFWSNDDDDNPITGPGYDYVNTWVDGAEDLKDFFPVFLDIKQLLSVLPHTTPGVVYKLKHEEEALNFVYTSLTRATAFQYRTDGDSSTGYGISGSLPATMAMTTRITAEGVPLHGHFLDRIKDPAQGDQGVILVEMRNNSERPADELAGISGRVTKPLRLVVEKDGVVIAEIALHLKSIEVAARKKGEAVPDNGVLVKTGDIIEVALDEDYFAKPNEQQTRFTWQLSQRKADGTFDEWADFGPHGKGTRFEHTMQIGGIYQIRALLNGTDEVLYKRKKSERLDIYLAYGPGSKSMPDSIGVCDTQSQIAICREAQTFYASTYYAPSNAVPPQYGFAGFSTESPTRCNIFVAHRAVAAGAAVPAINGHTNPYPPLANEWAGIEDTSIWPGDPTFIEGWPILPVGARPQPGWIIAHPDPAWNQSGHVAITDYDGEGIGAGTSGTVNKRYEEFWDGTSRLRRYAP